MRKWTVLFRQGEALMATLLISEYKEIFREPESLNGSQGHDLARFTIFVFSRETAVALYLDLNVIF